MLRVRGLSCSDSAVRVATIYNPHVNVKGVTAVSVCYGDLYEGDGYEEEPLS
jgi:hypothetical protein